MTAHRWQRIMLTVVVVLVVATLPLVAFVSVNTRDRISASEKRAYLATCMSGNESRVLVSETNDTMADLLEALRPLVAEPETLALADAAIARLRVNLPLEDCSYPPNGRLKDHDL